ncbi:hypothetical protein CSAL01_05521 [Colletotrichum salicis]|uniref:Uncharacterized protein n=1 Tax=Colletotrichum salicis TaxID=1209931 RepID=A0A135TTX8_9PEZI|nr:hypothetical protein CSAL01_05521 [Colletotrichum salicis]
MIRRKTRDLLQCHSFKPLPFVAVICQHELHTTSNFGVPPIFADLSGGPKSSNDEGMRSILQRPIPCDYDAESDVDRRRPKFCLRPCAITHTLQRRRLANPRRCPNHKIFRETNMARMRQPQMPNEAYGYGYGGMHDTTSQLMFSCGPLIIDCDHRPPAWSQISESGRQTVVRDVEPNP